MVRQKKAAETPAQRLKRETQQAEREHWELWLLRDILARRLPEPLRQYQWHPRVAYRADVAWVVEQLMVEVDGGIWQKRGGHTTGKGYEHDRIRDAEALCLGWTVLRVTPGMVERGAAVDYIERVLHAIGQRNKRNKRQAA